jgi:tight adherence protein C
VNTGLAALLVGLSVFLTCYAIFAPRGKAVIQESSLDSTDSFGRYIRPMLRNFIPQTPLNAQLSGAKRQKIQELLIRSGNPWKIRVEEYEGIKILFAAIGLFAGIFLSSLDLIPVVPGPVIVIGFALAGYVIPFSIHNSKREERAREVRKQLPEALDLLVITLASGQNFEPALGSVVPRLPEGLLREELSIVNSELRQGRTIKEALTAFARRASSDEVESFAKAVAQAQDLGSDVSETLANQAGSARQAYEASIEKKIARLSTTMFMPLILTMIPALMIIFLGPTTATLGAAFGG